MRTREFITKDNSFQTEGRQEFDIQFFQATKEDLRKQMEVADISSLPDGYIAGWASTPDLDHYRHRVMPGAFDDSIAKKGLSGPKGIKLLIGHDRSKPAGKIVKLETRNGSLWMEAQLNLKISYVRDMYEAAKENDGLSFSVGFYLEEWEVKQDADKMEFLQINKGELEEVSLVVFPGNENAVNTFIKNAPEEFDTVSALEKALVASGLARTRNDANAIVKMVKKCPSLCTKVVEEPHKPKAPVAKEKIDGISALAAELKSIFD